MTATKEEWGKLMIWIQTELCKQLIPPGMGHHYADGIVTKPIIVGTLQELTQEQFIADSSVKKERKKATDIEYSPEFELWWALYPSGKGFTYMDKKILSSERNLRDDKEKTYKKYKEVKDATPAQLLHALRVEVEKRKIESYKTGENKFQYMKASIAYLNIKRYNFYVNEPFPVPEKSSNFADTAIDI